MNMGVYPVFSVDISTFVYGAWGVVLVLAIFGPVANGTSIGRIAVGAAVVASQVRVGKSARTI